MIGGFIVGIVCGVCLGITLMCVMFIEREENDDLSKELSEFNKRLKIIFGNEPMEEDNNHD